MAKGWSAVILALALPLNAAALEFDFGLGTHTAGLSRPEVNLKLPIGIIGVTQSLTENASLRCVHISSASMSERGIGFNGCWLSIKTKVFD